jgi:hypothetical protein
MTMSKVERIREAEPRARCGRGMSIATRLALPGISAAFMLSLFTHCHAAEQVPVRFIGGLPVIEVRLGDIKADFVPDTVIVRPAPSLRQALTTEQAIALKTADS